MNRIDQYIRKQVDNLQQHADDLRTAQDSLRGLINIHIRALLNRPFSAPGLVVGSVDPKKIKATNTTGFLSGGLFKSKATFETTFGVDAATVVPISSFTKYLVCLQADGTPHVIEGNNAASAGAALLPAVPTGETPIGYCQVATDGVTTFTPDTTSLAAAGITDTYVDLAWPDSGADAIAALNSSGVGLVGQIHWPIS